MADFRRYQPRRSGSTFPWRGIIIFGMMAVAVVLVGRAMWGGGGPERADQNQHENAIRLVSDNSNVAVTNTSESATNTNTTPITPPDTADFSLDACPGAISQFGSQKVLALTFNVAGDNEQTRALIEVLKQTRTPASWFVSGALAETSTALVGDISAAGFGVYNRTYDNPRLSSLSAEQVTDQLVKAEQAISTATGRSTKPFLRPPFGDVDADVVATAKAQGYCTVLWTVDAFDWQTDATAASASQRVLEKLRPGAIIMFSAGFDATTDAVERVIAAAKEDGYQFVSLIDLIKT